MTEKDQLRRQAEALISQGADAAAAVLSLAEARRVLHELRVHQIELEMQNEELRRAQAELDAARARYFDLYDLAPVGYVTVNEPGLILEANLTAATLLGVARGALVKRPFYGFLFKADQGLYYRHRKQLLETGEPQACELRMVKKGGGVFWAHLASTTEPDHDGSHVCRITLSDITLRMKTQAELKASESRFRSYFDLPLHGIAITSLEKGWIEVNARLCSMLGYTRAELLRMTWSEMAHPDDLAADVELFDRMLSGQIEQYQIEKRFIHKDGQVIWTNLAVGCVREADGRVSHVVAVLDDITGRKREQDYRETGLNILQIFNKTDGLHDSVRLVLALLKERTGFDAVGLRLQDGEDFPYFAQQGFPEDFLSTENTLVECGANGVVCRDQDGKVCLECTCGLVLSGKTDPSHPSFTLGGSFWTNESFPLLDLPPSQDPRWHPRNQCMLHGYASMALIPVKDKERIVGLLHLNVRGKGGFTLATIELLEGIATYIGAALTRKQVETDLRESEDRFSRLAEQSGTFIWETDAQGLYTYVSPVVEKVLGYRPDELVGRLHFYDLHPESGREAFKAEAFASFQRKDAFAGLVNAVQTKDGNLGWVLTTGMPVLNADGGLRGYQGSDTDITARKRADEELQKLQKLQSVGVLAGGIAHDFNNIMTGLFGNISLAKDELAQDHPSHLLLAEAEKSMSRAVQLTKQLLTFAKGGDPIKADVCLGTLVQDVAHFDLSGSPVRLVYQQPDDLWLADVDKGQIQQVISNLTINARQAMPTGGCLYLSLENVTLPAGAIPSLCPGKYIRGTVRDEGTGIDSKNIERIFDPYFTTKQTGSGLGLATVYSIITKHGGRIGVESELGKGTTFTFYLPASGSPLQAGAVPPAATVPPLDRPAKILVMDDEDAVCRLVERALTRCGFEVAAAPGGQEAIAMYQQAMTDGAPFDAAILDLTIPGGMGGKDTIKELLAIDPHAKAIVSSGYADDPVMANYADYGFKGCVTKPYTTSELRAVLAQILK